MPSIRRVLAALAGAVILGSCSSPTVLPAEDAGTTVPGTSFATGTTSTATTALRVRFGPVGVREPRFAGARVITFTGDTVSAFDAASLASDWVSEPCARPKWPGPYYLHMGRVIAVECGGEYRGLDPDTGVTKWNLAADGEVSQFRIGADTMSILSPGWMRTFDTETGALRWQVPLGEAATFVSDESVFMGTKSGMMATDAHAGSALWGVAFDTTDIYTDGKIVYLWSWASSKARLLAFDAHTGEQKWVAPVVADNKVKTAIVGVTAHTVVVSVLGPKRGYEGFSREDGHLLWDRLGEDNPEHSYKLSVAQDAVVLCSANGEVVAYDDRTALRYAKLGESVDGFCPANGNDVASVVGIDQNELQITTIPDL